MAADVCVATAVMVAATALLKSSANPVTDNVFFPYAVVSLSIVGLVMRSLPAVLAVPAATAASYVAATGIRFGLSLELFGNVFNFWAYALIGWLTVGMLRRVGRRLDEARDAAEARAARLGRERERHQIARDLHDRVLQTLEFLARGECLTEPWVRDRLAEETAWLRGRIDGAFAQQGRGALLAALEEVVREQTRAGLRVDVNTAGAADVPVPLPALEALLGAVTEALTNVRKHSGGASAVLRVVCMPAELTVTVVDRGRGFDTVSVAGGFGLAQSIVARIEEAGGRAQVRSVPGEGTQVEISVLVARPSPGGTQLVDVRLRALPR
ncbi:MAG: hypothetical protein M3Y33_01185 [Actinomycetota bacterium]|nr:hypothetical protein [Actinomycetota bacterium]